MKRGRTHKGKKFRVGQRVCSVHEPERVFIIGESRVPERIFREKGTKNWFCRNELQAIGDPENPATSLRLNGKKEMREDARKCAQGVSAEPNSEAWLPKQSCLECGAIFQPTRPWQRFNSEPCRRAYWKHQSRLRAAVKGPPESTDTNSVLAPRETVEIMSQASAGDGMTAQLN